MLACSVDDLRHVFEHASGDELAPVLSALGVQSRSAGRKAPQLLRSRLRTFGHEACHDVACVLTQPVMRALEALVPDADGDLEPQLQAGAFDQLRRAWPAPLVRLTVETLWHLDDLDLAQRDRFLALVEQPPAAPPADAPADVPTGVVDEPVVAPPAREPDALDAATTALDTLLAAAIARARAGSAALGHLASLRIALEELIALDPARPAAWYHYGLISAVIGDEAGEVLQPLPGPARLSFVLGQLRGLVDTDATDRLVRIVRREQSVVDELLRRPEGSAVAGRVVVAHLDDIRAAARFLGLAAAPFDGWQDAAREVHRRVDALVSAGSVVDAELLLRALEEALWQWAAAGDGRGRGFEEAATTALLRRVVCRRRRSDFVGASRLLDTVEDAFLAPDARAAAACERALIGAEIPGLETVRFPRGDAERARFVERLRPVASHLAAAVDADPTLVTANVLLGMLLHAEGDVSAAPALATAAAGLAEAPEPLPLATEVDFHAALARLRLLEPGTDEAAYRDMARALDAGYVPGAEDLASAVVALEAHGSPHAGALLAAALRVAPAAPALVELVVGRARTGDEAACSTAEVVAADSGMALSTRVDLLDAALVGAGLRRDTEAAERLAGSLDDVLVRAGDAALDARFAALLGADETLRAALDPAAADALRLEVLRRIGRIEEARAIALAMFYRAAGGGLRGFDAADLFHVLVELGLAPAELDDLARLLPSPPDGGEPATGLDRPVHVLFVGGNETQDRYRTAIDASVALRYDGKVRITWFLSGWRSNWHTDAARIEAAYGQADAVVLMTFIRTHLGQRVRRSAGDAGLPWVACTGHGREAIERAVDRAVAIVGDQVPSAG
ncbi:MAG TPA: hypothetical protein VM938_14385 [Acidimicrobiales bacterium]|nr:hypothetical protein [Acidimicrobiales bacterium]